MNDSSVQRCLASALFLFACGNNESDDSRRAPAPAPQHTQSATTLEVRAPRRLATWALTDPNSIWVSIENNAIPGKIQLAVRTGGIALDPRIAGLVLLRAPAHGSAKDSLVPMRCDEGDIVTDIDRDLLEAVREIQDPLRTPDGELRLNVDVPVPNADEAYRILACFRDTAGNFLNIRPDRLAQTFRVSQQSFFTATDVLTPSGYFASWMLGDAGGVLRSYDVEGSRAMDTHIVRGSSHATRLSPMRVLRTDAGIYPVADLAEVWVASAHEFREGRSLAVGDTVLVDSLRTARIASIEMPDEYRGRETSEFIEDVASPDTYFARGILVRDGHPSRRPTNAMPSTSDPETPATVAPPILLSLASHTYDCMADGVA